MIRSTQTSYGRASLVPWWMPLWTQVARAWSTVRPSVWTMMIFFKLTSLIWYKDQLSLSWTEAMAISMWTCWTSKNSSLMTHPTICNNVTCKISHNWTRWIFTISRAPSKQVKRNSYHQITINRLPSHRLHTTHRYRRSTVANWHFSMMQIMQTHCSHHRISNWRFRRALTHSPMPVSWPHFHPKVTARHRHRRSRSTHRCHHRHLRATITRRLVSDSRERHVVAAEPFNTIPNILRFTLCWWKKIHRVPRRTWCERYSKLPPHRQVKRHRQRFRHHHDAYRCRAAALYRVSPRQLQRRLASIRFGSDVNRDRICSRQAVSLKVKAPSRRWAVRWWVLKISIIRKTTTTRTRIVIIMRIIAQVGIVW